MKQNDLVDMIARTLSVIEQIEELAEEVLTLSEDKEIRGYYQGVRDQAGIATAALAHIKGMLERSEIQL